MKKQLQEPEQSGGQADWMATYTDMVTLLFAFFVLLFAISQVDVQKFNLLAASLSNKGASPEQIMEIGQQYNLKNEDEIDMENPKIPLPVGEDKVDAQMQNAYDIIKEHISQSGIDEKVSVSQGDDYIFIRFVDDMLFEPNSARIREQDYEFLSFVGNSLLSVQNDVGMIRIDGHTAAVPEQQNYQISDRDLSSDRANAVLKYFEDVIGIRGDKLNAFAFGKYHPIASNATEETRKKNRRIEILITKSNEITTQLDNIYEKLLE